MTRHLIHWRVLALHAMVGATVGISLPSQQDISTGLKPDGSKIYQNLPAVAYWAYGAVMATICQRSPQPLCQWPQLAN
jgi:hypothetical protein